MKEAVKSLWRECFNESEEFLEFYFRYKYSEDVNMVITEQDEVIAALQMLPYSMEFCKTIIPTSYISGVCTHPDYRQRGAMRNLLEQSFASMYGNDVLFATLIPAQKWLFDYYARLGFVTVFDYSVSYINVSQHDITDDIEVSRYRSSDETALCSFIQSTEKGHGRVLHSTEDLRTVAASLEIYNGRIYICKKHGIIICCLIAYLDDKNQITVHTLCSESCSETCLATLNIVAKEWNAIPTVKVIAPVRPQYDSVNLGMARVINIEKSLNLYASYMKTLSVSFNIVDDVLPQNNGLYKIENGICIKSNLKSNDYLYISVSELTQALLGCNIQSFSEPLSSFENYQPYMNLMLD